MSSFITHPLEPVWSPESRVLLLGTMPSPKSREAGFYYMHPQNRFWRVLPLVFSETLSLPNNAPDIQAAIAERRDFLMRHRIALWDVLAGCQIEGASDASIQKAVANDFTEIFAGAHIRHVFFTGKTAASLWKKHCGNRYTISSEFSDGKLVRSAIPTICLPSTSPANARFTLEMLVKAYSVVRDCME